MLAEGGGGGLKRCHLLVLTPLQFGWVMQASKWSGKRMSLLTSAAASFRHVVNMFLTGTNSFVSKKQIGTGKHFYVFFVCVLLGSILVHGCSHFSKEYQASSLLKEANEFFNQGDYEASLSKHEQILEKYPKVRDRVLFEMGMIYASSKNEQKDYQKSVECFQRIVKDYPGSGYRKDSEMMIFYINSVTTKDKTIAAQQMQMDRLRQKQTETLQEKDRTIATQQTQIDTFQQEVKVKGEEITKLQKKMEALEQQFILIQKGPADKILIEKQERRLTLISKGEVLKTYKIALGGNPIGPKERQGDNKTPEGVYVIDSRNKDSRYHRSLHVSYPNEKDRQRAKKLGVSPGGDIMIHGMKNGFSWVGESHTGVDWTKGCIAVTDEEIEEIERLVPNGTVIEIRP